MADLNQQDRKKQPIATVLSAEALKALTRSYGEIADAAGSDDVRLLARLCPEAAAKTVQLLKALPTNHHLVPELEEAGEILYQIRNSPGLTWSIEGVVRTAPRALNYYRAGTRESSSSRAQLASMLRTRAERIKAWMDGGSAAHPTDADIQESKGVKRSKWMAGAMLLVRDHPDWSDAKIAHEVDIDPSQLSRCPEYQRAAAMARGDKSQLPRGYGTTDPDDPTGPRDLEAYSGDS